MRERGDGEMERIVTRFGMGGCVSGWMGKGRGNGDGGGGRRGRGCGRGLVLELFRGLALKVAHCGGTT